MKSNAQLWHEGQGEAPQPPPVQLELPTGASSSQTAPPPPSYKAGFAQVMSALSSIQREVNSISVRVEQYQIDIQECLNHHHLPHDDEDRVLLLLYVFYAYLRHFTFIPILLNIGKIAAVVLLYSVDPLSF
jgi:hypothetical protein